jgi:hypothetical protein
VRLLRFQLNTRSLPPGTPPELTTCCLCNEMIKEHSSHSEWGAHLGCQA